MKSKNYWYTRIFKTEPGQLFKGHRMELTTDNDDENGSSITISHQYYNMVVRQKYKAKSNKTEIHLMYTLFSSKTPKWYTDVLTAIEAQSGLYNPPILHCENGEYAIHFSRSWVYLKRTFEMNGIYMTNHYDNIQSKKDMSKMSSRLIHNFKELSINELLSFPVDKTKHFIKIPSYFME